MRVAGGAWQAVDTNGIEVPSSQATSTVELRARDAVGNLSSMVTATASTLSADPDDDVSLDTMPPTPGDQEVDGEGPLTPDEQLELQELLADEDAAASDTARGWLDPAPQARSTYPPNGFNNLPFTCAGAWAPVQAAVSGFVIGNCEGDTAALGWKTFVSKPGDYPGAPSEGRGWEAVSLPAEAHFDACGWINLKNWLDNVAGTPPANRCSDDDLQGPTFDDEAQYVKRYAGTRIAGANAPNTTTYKGLYIWARRFLIRGVRHEASGYKYVPHFSSSDKTCTAYANVNPYKPGQQVRMSERMWSVHSGSPNVRIRYIARYRAKTEAGDLNWWVMTRSISPSDSDQPWGFVSASCLFSD